ncbi:MAG TPA: arginine deiminase-related protein, partial [Arenibacter sp.]|nr:arginine deiminase-related protein [Arenibacter sp.]
MMQITNTILMVRPVNFRRNEQTAINNYFQADIDLRNREINAKAQEEFDAFTRLLKEIGVTVIVVDDTEDSDTPDAVFPNNWVSFHEDGTVGLYPMFAENRRGERR